MYLDQPEGSAQPAIVPPPTTTAGLYIYPRHASTAPRPDALKVSIPSDCLGERGVLSSDHTHNTQPRTVPIRGIRSNQTIRSSRSPMHHPPFETPSPSKPHTSTVPGCPLPASSALPIPLPTLHSRPSSLIHLASFPDRRSTRAPHGWTSRRDPPLRKRQRRRPEFQSIYRLPRDFRILPTVRRFHVSRFPSLAFTCPPAPLAPTEDDARGVQADTLCCRPDVDDVIGPDGETFGAFTKRVLGRHYAEAPQEAED